MGSLFSYPLRMVKGFLDRAFSLAGAILLAQFPQFYGQYIQRLAGHLDEARRTVELYEETAISLGLTLEQYIEQHLASDSAVFAATGRVIASLLERVNQLEHSFKALLEAAPLLRWWIFLQEAEWTMVLQTWRDFTPGIPTSMEGLLYASAGLLLGWGCYITGKYLIQKLMRLVRGKALHSS